MATVAENPLTEGLERMPVHPTTLVIFGGTGDLAHRKLLPAVYNLAHEGALPERFNLVAVSRADIPHGDYQGMARESINQYSRRSPDPKVLDKLLENVRYVPGTFDDDSVYDRLEETLDGFDYEAGIPFNRVFYLSTAPAFFPVIVGKIGEQHLDHHEGAEVRVVIEKPFGTRLTEAVELNRQVLSVLDESQVFRIDHYLGKETVQNMLAFRFANGLFEPIWNRNYIDYVQITAAEDLGIGSRAGYYDTSGALRDLVENHMMQLLTLLCMEPPVTFSADDVRDEKVKVLHAIRPVTPEETVRARYTAGMAEGKQVVGYLEEEGVPADSKTETYAALRARGGQLALGGGADLHAHRQAPGAQGHRDRRDAQAGAAPGLRGRGLGGGPAQPARDDDAAQRGGVAVARREDPGHADAHPPGEHGVPLRHRLPVAVARGLRAPDHGRDARRRHALHARRRGGGPVARDRPDPRGLGQRRGAGVRVRGRHLGTRGGGRAAQARPPLADDLAR